MRKMSSTGNENQASTGVSAALPGVPAVLNREPSQQDLEVARQLIAHSQRVPPQPTPESHTSQEPQQRASVSGGEGISYHLSNQEHHDLSDSLHEHVQPYASPPNASPTDHRAATNGGTLMGGQLCSNCGTTKTPLWRRSPAGAVICNACGLYYKARNQMRPVGLKRGAAAATPSMEGQPHDRGSSPSSIQPGATYVAADDSTPGTCPGGGRCNGTGGHQGCNGCPAYNNRISKTAQFALQQSDQDGSSSPTQNPVQTSTSTTNVVVACQNCGTTITPLWRRDEAGQTICNACGLYHKLHGTHRPVQMKKAEIKRRKRVVPANLQQQPQQHLHDRTSPQASEIMDEDMQSDTPLSALPSTSLHADASLRPHVGGPIPVDFTDTFRHLRTVDDEQIIPRKRSFSVTNNGAEDHPYQHAQNLPDADLNIDPALPSRGSTVAASASKEAKRVELRQEAEKYRKMLLEKEKELAELG